MPRSSKAEIPAEKDLEPESKNPGRLHLETLKGRNNTDRNESQKQLQRAKNKNNCRDAEPKGKQPSAGDKPKATTKQDHP